MHIGSKVSFVDNQLLITNNLLPLSILGDQRQNYQCKWFPQDKQQQITDNEIYDLFANDLHLAMEGEYDDWRSLGKGIFLI